MGLLIPSIVFTDKFFTWLKKTLFNLKQIWAYRVLIFSAVLFSTATNALSVPDLLNDPLLTRPPVLKFGASLPDGAPINCPAQVDLNQSLGLSEVLDLALCNNPKIAQAWAQIKIQAASLGEAKAAYLPTVTATYSPQKTQTNYPNQSESNTYTNGYQQYANATWRLFDFGGRAANKSASYFLLKAALDSHDAAIQKAMADVIQSYFDVLTNKAIVDAKEQAMQLAQSSWEATLRREKQGVSAKSDTLQAQTALAKSQLAASRANGDYKKAQAQLVFVIGLSTNSQLMLQEQYGQLRKEDMVDLNTWLAQAEQEHPAIKSAKAQWESNKQKVVVARSAGLPTADLFTNYYKNGFPNQGLQTINSNVNTVGISISIPIFDGFGTTYKIRGAQAQVEKSEADLADTTRQILIEIVKSYADTQSSLTNLTSSQKLLDAAKSSVDSSIKRYDNGAADILELLTTQNILVEAQQERIRCVAEYQSAKLRLMANSGTLGAVNGDRPPKVFSLNKK
jgi:outer membrane protein